VRAGHVVLLTALVACGWREPAPPLWARDARFGRLGGSGEPPTKREMCRSWPGAVIARDGHARRHTSFPETNARAACFTPVTHDGRDVRVGAAPPGCRYPDSASRRRVVALAAELDELAANGGASPLFPCALSTTQRAAALRQNADALRALAAAEDDYPYAAVVLPGHGLAEQDEIALSGLLPDRGCDSLPERDLPRFGAMTARSAIGADAVRGGVAPVVIASGGAVHSHVVEAFALAHLLVCREHVPPQRILVEPCADHTHTNLRNSARWLAAIDARAAYLVTDDGLQADYFQDWSGFDLILGSVDQRSLRDWGYVIGSWRQASIGTDQGFWFTPYRFWAEPREGLGSVTCAVP
jgi:uncharacterized SAM-binding protein YcdF (DUF218 family)